MSFSATLIPHSTAVIAESEATKLAMTENHFHTVVPGRAPARTRNDAARKLACSLPRTKPDKHKIDHLIDGGARLVHGLGDHLRVEEADHGGAGAHRGRGYVGHPEFARRRPLRDHAAD